MNDANVVERSGDQYEHSTNGGRGMFSFFASDGVGGSRTISHPNQYFVNGRRVSWYHKARHMRKDPTVNFLRMMFIGRMISNDYEIEHETGVPDEIVEFAREQVKNYWPQLLKDSAFGCLDFGWQPFETIYRLEDGYWVVDKLKPLLQDITSILKAKSNGSFLGFQQGINSLRVEDGGIALTNVMKEGTNHYGCAPLKALNDPYDRQQTLYTQIEKYDGRLAASHWILYYPIGLTEIDPNKGRVPENLIDNFELAQELMQGLLATGSIIVPSSIDESIQRLNQIGGNSKGPWRIELLSNGDGGGGKAPYSERLKYYDNLKARALGFPERSVFEGEHGTKSESESQTETSSVISAVHLSDICEGINETFLADVITTNFGARYAKKVKVKPNPVKLEEQKFYKSIYERLLADPELLLIEQEKIDMQALRERLNIPVDVDVDQDDDGIDDVPIELSLSDCGAGSGDGGGFGKGNTCARGGSGMLKKQGIIDADNLISSQRFRDDDTVDEKIQNEDFEVFVSPLFEYEGETFQVVLDGHHSFEAAKRSGNKLEVTVYDKTQHDAVRLLEKGDIDGFLEVTHLGDDYYNLETEKDVW